ncbi:DinB family protein [soil metagenome]
MTLEAAPTTFTIASLLGDYAAYNAWANKTLVEWLQKKPMELMDEVVPSSFPSLKETLVHIWDTQRFWLAVLQQVPPPPSFRMTGFSGTVDEVFTEIMAQSNTFATYVKSLSEDDFQDYITLVTPWVKGTRTRIEFIQHCLNHSTYHRGQVVTIGRNVGLTDAPMTDYSFYFLRAK